MSVQVSDSGQTADKCVHINTPLCIRVFPQHCRRIRVCQRTSVFEHVSKAWLMSSFIIYQTLDIQGSLPRAALYVITPWFLSVGGEVEMTGKCRFSPQQYGATSVFC